MRKILLVALSCTCVGANAAIVGRWAADGDTTDSILGNNGATVGTVNYVAGKFGQAFLFTGGSSRIEVADSSAYAFGTGNFSVAFWVNFTAFDDSSTGMVSKDNYAGGGTYNGWLLNRDDSKNGIGFLTRNEPTGSTSARTPASAFSVGTWYHFAAVRESSQIRFYVDGVLAQSATEGTPRNVTTTEALRFGSLSPASLQTMSGALDEIRLYDSALSQSEITELATVPEPATAIVLSSALLGLLRRRRS